MKTLGEKLLALRSASGRTLKEVSDELGLADGHLAAIESGKIANPRAGVVAALADYYGVDIGALVNARQRLALSPETSEIVRLFEDKLTPEQRRLILRYAQLFLEHVEATTKEPKKASSA